DDPRQRGRARPRGHPFSGSAMRCFLPAALLAVFYCCHTLAPSSALAQNSQTSALISEQLDRPVSLDLNTTLPEAIKVVAKQTGVRIEATPAVWELLPWGDQTNITAKVQNVTLKDVLTAITRKLGLEWNLKD